MKRLLAVVSLAALVSACGSSSTSPTPTPPATTPTAAVTVTSFTVSSEASGTGSVYHAVVQFRETTGVVGATLSTLTFSIPGTNGSAQATLPTTKIAAGGTLTTPTISITDSTNGTAGATSIVLSATFTDDNTHTGSISGTANVTRGTPAPPAPAPVTTFTLTGTVTDGTSHGILPNVTVQIASGANAGRSAVTDGSGNYSMAGLSAGTFTLSIGATSYQTTTQSVTLSANVRVDLVLQRVAAAPAPTPTPTPTPAPGTVFTRSGVGNTVFDMPTTVSRVRIVGTYTGFASNFIVHIGGGFIVNDLLGTGFNQTVSDGIYLTHGGVVEIVSSTGVSWSFTEIR